jgi:hypothetical protein
LRAITVQEQEHEIDLSAALNIDVPPEKSLLPTTMVGTK